MFNVYLSNKDITFVRIGLLTDYWSTQSEFVFYPLISTQIVIPRRNVTEICVKAVFIYIVYKSLNCTINVLMTDQ